MVLKKEIFVLSIALLSVQLVACERSEIESESPAPSNARTRDGSVSNGTSRIQTSKTAGIRQKEPMLFTLIDAKSPHVMWRVIPKQMVENRGTECVIYFQQAGKFRVLAMDSIGVDTAFIDVEVTDEVYVRADFTQDIQEDDELVITPRTFADSANYLDLKLTTRRAYECTENELRLQTTKTDDPYECIVTGVDLPWECFPGKIPATGIWVLGRRLEDGASGQISIEFKGTVYKGSFKRTGRGYTFNWPYASGVTFTTKSI